MKRTIIIILAVAAILLACCTIPAVLAKASPAASEPKDTAKAETTVKESTAAETTAEADPETAPVTEPATEPVTEPATEPVTEAPTPAETVLASTGNLLPQITPADDKDALFIGDSRTVGLMDYANLSDADFFCAVGMSVYNIHQNPISVPGVGKVYLEELLSAKKYDKIYVMLGINELGYNMDYTVKKYGELLNLIESYEAGANIFIEANLHVSKERSQSDSVINNPKIDLFNKAISSLAEKSGRYFMDSNILFDDSNGCLSPTVAHDDAHLTSQYYEIWGQWILKETTRMLS